MSLWAPATSSSYVGVTLPVLTNHQQIYELICAQTTWSLTEIFQILRITTQDDGRWYDFVFLGHLKSDFLCAKKNLFYQTKPALTFQKKRMKDSPWTLKKCYRKAVENLLSLCLAKLSINSVAPRCCGIVIACGYNIIHSICHIVAWDSAWIRLKLTLFARRENVYLALHWE